MRPADGVQPGEGLVLEGLVLRDRLDDEIAVLEVLELDRALDPPERLVLGASLHLRLGHLRLQALADTRETLVEETLIGFDHDGGEPRLCRDLRDAGAHEPAADDADLLDGHARTTSLVRGANSAERRYGYLRPRPGSGTAISWAISPGGHGFLIVIVTEAPSMLP